MLTESIWIEDQTIGFGSRCLTLTPEDFALQTRLVDLIDSYFELGIAVSSEDKIERPLHLKRQPTPATAESLCDLDNHIFKPYSGHFTGVRDDLIGINRKDISKIGAAKLVADRIKYSFLTKAEIIRLAKKLGSDDFSADKQHADALDALGELIEAHRESKYDDYRLFHVTNEFLSHQPPLFWQSVAHALLQAMFAWPLMVLEDKGVNDKRRRIGCSLPTLLDIRPGGTGVVNVVGGKNLKFDFHALTESLSRSRRHATRLWRHKCRSWDFRYQNEVAACDVALDLSWADKVIAPFSDLNMSIEFYGRSMELCLTFHIMARFIDRTAMESTLATGMISSVRGDKDDPKVDSSAFVEMPEGISSKLNWGINNAFFDRLLVPDSTEIEYLFGEIPTYLSVERASNTEQFTSKIFEQKRQRHTFIRCADLAIAAERFYDPDQPIPKDLSGLYQRIKNFKRPILWMPKRVSAKNVVRTLFAANSRAKHIAQSLNSSQSENKKFIASELLRSYLVIRAVEDEKAERFWETLWKSIGGDAIAFEKLRFSNSVEEIAATFAERFNDFVPNAVNPTRPPDVLVIVGAKHLRSKGACPSGPLERLSIDKVVEHLNSAKMIKWSKPGGIIQHFGNCRIILIEDDWLPAPNGSQIDTDYDTAEILKKLSVFRFGFTRQLAKKILAKDDADIDSLLRPPLKNPSEKIGVLLQIKDQEGKPILRYAKKSKEYVFSNAPVLKVDDNEKAMLHLAAANAYVSIFNQTNESQFFDFRSALKPASVHEAQWHLGEAERLQSGEERTRVQHAQNRLTRIASPFGWGQIGWWTRRNTKEINPELLDALIEHLDRSEFARRHPIELVLAAQYILDFDQSIRGDATLKNRYADLQKRAAILFNDARQVCSDYDTIFIDGVSEKDACIYLVSTARACMILRRNADRSGIEPARSHIRTAFQYTRSGIEILDKEWFEFGGDIVRDPKKSLKHYKLGFKNKRIPHFNEHWVLEPFVKYIGACLEAGEPIGLEAEHVIKDFSVGRGAYLAGPHGAYTKGGLHKEDYVRRRWARGRGWILNKLKLQPTTTNKYIKPRGVYNGRANPQKKSAPAASTDCCTESLARSE